jgi:hypothetical protein
MRNPTDEEITWLLVPIISDGFNRLLGALEKAEAVKKTKGMRDHYRGVGSKYYDLVTEQIVLTARYGEPGVRKLFLQAHQEPDTE